MWTLSEIISSELVTEKNKKADESDIVSIKTIHGKITAGVHLRRGCLCKKLQTISGKGSLQLEKKARV